jgi:hypothetical protein
MRAAQSDAFTDALESIRAIRLRPDFLLDEAPAPARLAPDACALTVDPSDADDDSFTGRFVLLHDLDGHEEWGGNFRVVIFAKCAVDTEVVNDPLLPHVGWSWLTESLAAQGAMYTNIGGTVTWSSGLGFGTLSDQMTQNTLEIRSSWSPCAENTDDIAGTIDRHVMAWIDLIAQMAGLPAVPAGVTAMGRRTH